MRLRLAAVRLAAASIAAATLGCSHQPRAGSPSLSEPRLTMQVPAIPLSQRQKKLLHERLASIFEPLVRRLGRLREAGFTKDANTERLIELRRALKEIDHLKEAEGLRRSYGKPASAAFGELWIAMMEATEALREINGGFLIDREEEGQWREEARRICMEGIENRCSDGSRPIGGDAAGPSGESGRVQLLRFLRRIVEERERMFRPGDVSGWDYPKDTPYERLTRAMTELVGSMQQERMEEHLPSRHQAIGKPLADSRKALSGEQINPNLPQRRFVGLEPPFDRPVILNRWGHGCRPCVEEMPVFDRLNREGRAYVVGYQVRFTMEMLSRETLREAVGRGEIPAVSYPLVNPERGEREGAGTLFAGPLPMTYILDRKGIVRHVIVGITSDREMERLLQDL